MTSGRNIFPYVSLGPDPNAPYNEKGKTEYKGGFAQLTKRGTLTIIGYTERGSEWLEGNRSVCRECGEISTTKYPTKYTIYKYFKGGVTV